MNPSFLLWHPAVLPDGSGCAFDVTQNEFALLGEGTAALVAESLQKLGIGATARSWKVETFCSPFFSQDLSSPEWVDRICRAWRVSVQFEQPWKDRLPVKMGPSRIYEKDPTWTYTDDISWSELPCEIIAHYAETKPDRLLERLDGDSLVGPITRTFLHLNTAVHQLRVNLGLVHLPDDEPKVMEVMGRCRDLGGLITWQSSMPLMNLPG